MNSIRHKGWVLGAWVLALSVVGCGSGSGSSGSSGSSGGEVTLVDSPATPLKLSGDPDAFAQYLRNGVQVTVNGSGRAAGGDVDFSAAPPPAAEAADGNSLASADAGNFSATNVHVQGIDEADRVKYDGQHLFVAEVPQSYGIFPGRLDFGVGPSVGNNNEEAVAPGIRVLKTHPEQGSAEEVAHIPGPDREIWGAELYLVGDGSGATRDLATLASGYQWDQSLQGDYFYSGQGKTYIDLYDVTAVQNPQRAWTLELDGILQHSRKMDDVLYLVTRYTPNLAGLGLEPGHTGGRRQDNSQRIADLPLEKLLPHYRISGGNPQLLVDSNSCYIPEDIESDQGYAELVTITAVDLGSRQLLSSVCLNTQISGFYMSHENLYLGSSSPVDGEWVTGVHKFSLDQGQIDYRGSGGLPGHIGWNAASFRMDEHKGDLRVVTTKFHSHSSGGNGLAVWFPQDMTHYLTILRENPGSNRMQQVAQLPNEQRPEDIGKPNEDIYAVRFDGDQAYIVTFEIIDPLYVLDLSDPTDPYIAGELEVPGVSTYLHTVGDHYLLGVGHDTNENGWITGVKVELYDISDMNNPQAIGTEIISDAWSNAVYDLRALNFLQVGEQQLRFTLPINVSNGHQWQHTGLYLYEINGLSGAMAQLDAAGAILAKTAENTEDYYWPHSNNGRSRLHDDTVYYIEDNDVWAAFWQAPQAASGPH